MHGGFIHLARAGRSEKRLSSPYERAFGAYSAEFLRILLLTAGTLLLIGGAEALGATGGLVIYKEFSFDSDCQAQIADYTTAEHFPSVDNVITSDGQTLRILPGQDPVYIPQAGAPSDSVVDVTRKILAAERRFPQFSGRLETLRRAWAAMPTVAMAGTPIAAKPSPPPTPAPQLVESAQPAPSADPANVLRTRYGEVYYAWHVSGIEGDNVVITHADGVSRVPIAALPDNLFGFPPEVVAQVQELRLQQAAQLRKIADKAAPHPVAGSPTPGKTH